MVKQVREPLCPGKRTHTADHPRAFQALPHLCCVLSFLRKEQHALNDLCPNPSLKPPHTHPCSPMPPAYFLRSIPMKTLEGYLQNHQGQITLTTHENVGPWSGQEGSSGVRYLLNRWALFSHLTRKQTGAGWKEDKPHPVPAPAFHSCASHGSKPGPDSCSTTFPSTLCSTTTSEPLRMSKFKASELSPPASTSWGLPVT